MASKIANKTIAFDVYNNTGGKHKKICDATNVELPKIGMLTDKLKGGGILGEIDLPSIGQLESMELKISYNKANLDAIEMFEQKTQSLEIRWASDVVSPDNMSVEIQSSKVIVKGIPKGLEQGKIEAQSSQEASVTLELLYYHLIIEGKSVIEIDKLNQVFKVNGVDGFAAVKNALK